MVASMENVLIGHTNLEILLKPFNKISINYSLGDIPMSQPHLNHLYQFLNFVLFLKKGWSSSTVGCLLEIKINIDTANGLILRQIYRSWVDGTIHANTRSTTLKTRFFMMEMKMWFGLKIEHGCYLEKEKSWAVLHVCVRQ